ncbi:MAG: DUF2127 domain-containing protein [Acidobacteriales bacterium]|nr:DUF2127 domain-containing protein [Terriglobales bacterium]
MKRPPLITALAGLAFVLAAVMMYGAGYLVWLAHSPEILRDKDVANAQYGLHLAAAVASGYALAFLAGSWAMWRGKRWGRWVIVAGNALVVIPTVLDLVGENHIDWDEAAVPVFFGLMAILYALPVVGRSTIRVSRRSTQRNADQEQGIS